MNPIFTHNSTIDTAMNDVITFEHTHDQQLMLPWGGAIVIEQGADTVFARRYYRTPQNVLELRLDAVIMHCTYPVKEDFIAPDNLIVYKAGNRYMLIAPYPVGLTLRTGVYERERAWRSNDLLPTPIITPLN